ncbi:MAG: plastocyanin/azurin family copper-binding protein [Pseudomonadota bacterium]
MKRRSLLVSLFLLPMIGTVAADEHVVQAIATRGFESMLFEPDFLQVAPGDTVTFQVDDFDHQPQSAFIPTGATPWRAEKGKSITVKLAEPGVYVFDCAYHNVMGMAGVIVVGEPRNVDEAREFFSRYRDETVFIDKDRLDHIWDPKTGALAALPQS